MNHIEQQLKIVKNSLNDGKTSPLPLQLIEQQFSLFINGVKIQKLVRPCLVNDGIVQIKENEYSGLLSEFDLAVNTGRLLKFVPASGAASRMFQNLQSVLNRFQNLSFTDLKIKSEFDKECKSACDFLINISRFAFYDDLKMVLHADDIQIQKLISESPREVIKAVLFEDGLNYSSKPKGAIKFHRYNNDCRTAFEEQIYESINYIAGKDKNIKIHFTISEEHTELFNYIIDELRSKLSKTEFKIDVTFSYQKKSTDTIAVDQNNNLLFDKDGNLVLRPGGHGALLENLNQIKADLAIIKNIDNLSVESLSADTIRYKKLLTGFLIKIQKIVFHFLYQLEKERLSKEEVDEIVLFAKNNLNITQSEKFDGLSSPQKVETLYRQLNRPIRICGMVKNEGEPGGSPFWVKSDDGSISLQIVERAQIDVNDENQQKIFMQSTHFNPVDLICSVRDYKGNNFDLHNFVDHQSGIISKKSKDGVELKALELPGLWNGGMAHWITIFVEVPISTFNPVKEVNDLLRETHQN
jgi:hypothetical protein